MMNQSIRKLLTKSNFIFLITATLMFIPIILAFTSPSITTAPEEIVSGWGPFKKVEIITRTYQSPFLNNIGGLAAIYAVIIYTIVLLRNKNTIVNISDVNKLNIKGAILHVLNLVFLITVCALIPNDMNILIFNINVRQFMLYAIILSLIGMRSIAGYIWIIVSICLIINLDAFDKWGTYAVIYIVCAYLSIASQVLLLNVFDFSINELLNDFGNYGQTIIEDTKFAVNLTKNKLTSIIK